MTDIIDWAREHTASTILSCLAAHAGVYHLDGIERRRLREKRFGLFAFTAQRDHPFVGKRGCRHPTPHSRYNEISQRELELAGYDVLASSTAYGSDIFTKSFGSQFVFLQGHPEYDANSLAREYRRDLSRYLRGDMDRPPAMPEGYFTADAEAELRGLERRARKNGSLPPEELAQIDGLAPPLATWRDAAISFYRYWVETIAASARFSADQSPNIEPACDDMSEYKPV